MDYLVVCPGSTGETKTVCGSEQEASDLIAQHLREGGTEADLKVYALEAIDFKVERVPVVSLADETSPASVERESSRPPEGGPDIPGSMTDDMPEKDSGPDPYLEEKVFSLDS